MASVQYLLGDVYSFRRDLYNKTRQIHDLLRKRAMAAILIQRRWRGYLARKRISDMTKAAITIQRWLRGWLVRWHLSWYWKEYIRCRNERTFYKMATRISSMWRGYWARKCLPDSMNMIKRRKARAEMDRQNQEMHDLMADAMNRLRGGPKSHTDIMEEEERCKEWVVYILQKCHHLLRTKHIPGIYSLRGQTDLSFIEQMLNSLTLRQYMDEIKKEYYALKSQPEPKTPYVYENRAMQKMEDLFRLRYKFNDIRKKSGIEINENTREMPFDLNTRIAEKPYEKLFLYDGEKYYIPKPFQRTEDPDLNISKHDFVLTKKMVEAKPDVPPYYIDDWDKQKCQLHYPVDMYGDRI